MCVQKCNVVSLKSLRSTCSDSVHAKFYECSALIPDYQPPFRICKFAVLL